MTLVAAVVLAGTQGYLSAAPAQQPDVNPIRGFERFQEWSRLVSAHEPGELDHSVRRIAEWPQADLIAARADLWAVVTLVNVGLKPGAMVQYTGFNQLIRPTQMARPTSRPRTIKGEDVADLLGLSLGSATGQLTDDDITRFMKRAAMLHTDVAMLSPPPADVPPPSRADMASTTRGVVDGEDTGWSGRPIHWEIARTALDGVRPAPGADAMVAAWYRATSAYLTFAREYGYLAPHVAKGRAILPKNAHLQMYSGVLHESHASPMVQAALQSLSSRSFTPTVKSAADELKLAEDFHRRALELDPTLAVARLHLGRVLSLLGRRSQAGSELRLALASLSDPRQRYYAELFLGAEEQAAGRAAEAKQAFERASAHFPQAQAPHLAIGQLAWQSSDRAGAQAAFDKLSGLPVDAAEREDPWWSYELSAVLDVAVLMEQLMRLTVEDVK